MDEVYLIKDKQLHPVTFDKSQASEFIYYFSTDEDRSKFIKAAHESDLEIDSTEEGVRIRGLPTETLNILVDYQIRLKDVITHHESMEEVYKSFYID